VSSKRTLGIIAAVVATVIILILYGVIVRAILNEREEQTSLANSAVQIEEAMAGQESGEQVVAAKQMELEALQQELEEAEFAFPSQVESTEVIGYINDVAQEQGVGLRQLQTLPPITGTVGSSTYIMLAYDVAVEGELGALSAFLTTLESGPISTLALDQIRLEDTSDSETYHLSVMVEVYYRP